MEMQLQLSAAQAAASAVEPVAGLESSAGGDSSSGSDSAGAVGGYSPAVSKKFLVRWVGVALLSALCMILFIKLDESASFSFILSRSWTVWAATFKESH